MLHKEAEQLILCAGQFQQDSVFVRLPLQQPDGDAARFQYGFSCAGRICTAKQCIDPRQQDTQLERLGQVIIPAHIQSHDDVHFLIRSGQEQNRHVGCAPHFLAETEARAIRKGNIQHQQVIFSV